ncbi:MAG: hypothetical protein IJ520_01320 [Synergistaceae bacterium]|nr:hypothetical protein [Synergistaceae bacterium]
MKKVIVIGAGPAGLTAAYELLSNGNNNYKGFAALTNLVYGVVGYTGSLTLPSKKNVKDHAFREFIMEINKNLQLILSPLFGRIGVINLIILICLLAKFKFKKLFLALPLFTYNFGTMLLLSGEDFRFFYYSLAIMPALILILLNDRGEMIKS